MSPLNNFSQLFSAKHSAPGHRPSSSMVIGRATLLSVAAVLVLECSAAGAALYAGYSNIALSVLCAAVLVAAANLISWGEIELMPILMPRFQSAGFFVGFALKAFLLLAAFYSLADVHWIDTRALVLAFAAGIVTTLLINSFVVLRAQSSD